jgi:hypothetical protein
MLDLPGVFSFHSRNKGETYIPRALYVGVQNA